MRVSARALAVASLLGVIASCSHLPVVDSAGSIELFRDRYGMAHVHARTEEDGYYAVGYALAEDRLLQVLTWYVAARGELAKTFGRQTPPPPGQTAMVLGDAVATDTIALKYRFLEVARANLPRLPAQYQRNLRAYVAGIEAYLREHPEKSPAWAPPLEPALPLAVFHLMVQEARQVCPARRRFDGAAPRAQVVEDAAAPMTASNAFAVSGKRSADGGAFFSADSHGPVQPHGTMFYPYRIKAGKLDFLAFEPAGTATFLFGHSDRFAWGVTEGPRFIADCYRVKLDAGSESEYSFDGKTLSIERVPYSIAVKGGPAVTGVFEYTRHNGVRSPVEERTEDSVYVVSYAQAERLGLGSGQYYRMAKARTHAEFEAALGTGDLYPANLLAAGADGTILFARPGALPVRAAGLDVRGTLDGNTSAAAWRGMHPYRELLKLIDPVEGYISNTNNSPDMTYERPPLQPKDFPAYYALEPGRTNERQRRLLELLGGNDHITEAAAKQAVMDETIPFARPWAARLSLTIESHSAEADALSPSMQACMRRLAQFDGEFAKESRAAPVFIELLRKLGSDRARYQSLSAAVVSTEPLDANQQRTLFDSARDACGDLEKRVGRSEVALGDIYRVGRGAVDFPVGGGQMPGVSTVRALQFGPRGEDGRQRMTGGQRAPFLVHFARDGVRSFAQVLHGVSDDPESPHFSDQARLASEKVMPEVALTREALLREGATLRPLNVRRDIAERR